MDEASHLEWNIPTHSLNLSITTYTLPQQTNRSNVAGRGDGKRHIEGKNDWKRHIIFDVERRLEELGNERLHAQ